MLPVSISLRVGDSLLISVSPGSEIRNMAFGATPLVSVFAFVITIPPFSMVLVLPLWSPLSGPILSARVGARTVSFIMSPMIKLALVRFMPISVSRFGMLFPPLLVSVKDSISVSLGSEFILLAGGMNVSFIDYVSTLFLSPTAVMASFLTSSWSFLSAFVRGAPTSGLSGRGRPSSPMMVSLPIKSVAAGRPFGEFPFSRSLVMPCGLPMITSSLTARRAERGVGNGGCAGRFLVVSFWGLGTGRVPWLIFSSVGKRGTVRH